MIGVFFAILVVLASLACEVGLNNRADDGRDPHRRRVATVVFAGAVLVLGLVAQGVAHLGACDEANLNPYCSMSTSVYFTLVAPGPAAVVLVGGIAAAETRRRGLLALSVLVASASIAVVSALTETWSG